MFETVIYNLKDDIAKITFNRPEALNALSMQLTRDTRLAIDRAKSDNARVVVLSGNGRAFCAGGDLREMQSMWEKEGRIEAFLEEPLAELHGVITSIRETPIPFIAAVKGICAGAGTNFALACDMIFATPDASFNEGFVKIGLSPDCGGSFFLPRAVGSKLAAELLMTGDSISADRAAGIGMINRVIAEDEFDAEVDEFALRLSRLPTAAIGRAKKMLNSTFSNDLRTQLALEHELQIESGKAADFKEGVASFFEKRPARFTGT